MLGGEERRQRRKRRKKGARGGGGRGREAGREKRRRGRKDEKEKDGEEESSGELWSYLGGKAFCPKKEAEIPWIVRPAKKFRSSPKFLAESSGNKDTWVV